MQDFIIKTVTNAKVPREHASQLLDAEADKFARSNNVASFKRVETMQQPYDMQTDRVSHAARYRATETQGTE